MSTRSPGPREPNRFLAATTYCAYIVLLIIGAGVAASIWAITRDPYAGLLVGGIIAGIGASSSISFGVWDMIRMRQNGEPLVYDGLQMRMFIATPVVFMLVAGATRSVELGIVYMLLDPAAIICFVIAVTLVWRFVQPPSNQPAVITGSAADRDDGNTYRLPPHD